MHTRAILQNGILYAYKCYFKSSFYWRDLGVIGSIRGCKLLFFTFLYSQFEDGMVVFSHPGIAQAGIWTYHAKLYPNTGSLSTTKMTVDVVSQSNNAEAEPFMLEVFSNEQGKSVY